MKYKLIAMDFDGTLLNDDKVITDKTRKCLEKYRDNGYTIVGVTARNLGSVKNVADINIFNYLILNNGSYIYDVSNDKEEYLTTSIKDELIKITNIMEPMSKRFEYSAIDNYYYYLDHNNSNLNFIKNIDSLSELPARIVKMNILLLDENKIEYYCEMLSQKFKEIECFIMQDSNDVKRWLALNKKGINKKSALYRLGKNIDITLEEMIFFGDSNNDLEIIQSVGMGVAMGNALENVKKCAKEITKSNNEDGIEYFLNKNVQV